MLPTSLPGLARILRDSQSGELKKLTYVILFEGAKGPKTSEYIILEWLPVFSRQRNTLEYVSTAPPWGNLSLLTFHPTSPLLLWTLSLQAKQAAAAATYSLYPNIALWLRYTQRECSTNKYYVSIFKMCATHTKCV